ncbi:MAG: TonB-dependent siderophore receptor [Novosphingobium sp.]
MISTSTQSFHARSLRSALGAIFLATSGLAVTALAAPSPAAAQAVRSYDIPAGTLADAINSFAEQSGAQILYDAALTQGRSSAGLKGRFGVAEGLSQLLAGSGMTFRQTGANIFTLQSAPQASSGAIQLGPVRVEGEGAGSVRITSDPNSTEGTGLYTGSRTTTAGRMPLTVQETPQSVTVVTRDRIDDFQLLTIDSVLTNVVGITQVRTESSRNTFSARGFAISNFQVDGVDANYLGSASGGRSPSLQFDSYLYDRIEVVRGATGLLSPTGDPSATINLVRKKPGKEFAAAGTFAVGSRDFIRAGVDLSAPIAADGGLRARVIGLYQQDDSWRDRASDKRLILSGMAELDASPTTLLRLAASYETQDTRGPSYGSLPIYDSDGGLIDLPRSTNLATTWSRWDKSELRTDLTLEQQIGRDWTFTGVVGHSVANSNPFLFFLGNGVPDADGDGRRFWSYITDGKRSQWSYDLTLRGNFRLFGREHMLVFGANGYRQKDHRKSPNYNGVVVPFLQSLNQTVDTNIYTFTGIAPEFTPVAPDTFTTTKFEMDGLFGSLRLSLAEPLHVIVGGRVTDWRTSNASERPGFQSFSENKPGKVFTPFAGVTFDIIPQLTLYVSYADVFTPQSERTVDDEIIEPIVGSNKEIGLKASLLDGRLAINAALYEAKLDNVAELVLPEVMLPDGSSAYRSTGKGNRTRGFEIEVSGAITDRWNIYAGFALNKTRDPAGVLVNTEEPRETFKFQTMWRMPVLDNRLSIGGGIAWQGKTYLDCDYCIDDAILRLEQKSYALVSLAANFDLTDKISLRLNATNLFDKTYYTYTGAGHYGEPRTVLLTANARF